MCCDFLRDTMQAPIGAASSCCSATAISGPRRLRAGVRGQAARQGQPTYTRRCAPKWRGAAAISSRVSEAARNRRARVATQCFAESGTSSPSALSRSCRWTCALSSLAFEFRTWYLHRILSSNLSALTFSSAPNSKLCTFLLPRRNSQDPWSSCDAVHNIGA